MNFIDKKCNILQLIHVKIVLVFFCFFISSLFSEVQCCWRTKEDPYFDVVTKKQVNFGYIYSRNPQNHNWEMAEYEVNRYQYQRDHSRDFLNNADKYNTEYRKCGGSEQYYQRKKIEIEKLKELSPTCGETFRGYAGYVINNITIPIINTSYSIIKIFEFCNKTPDKKSS